MAEYIVAPIDTDPDQLQEDAFDFLQTRWPNWQPNEGNLVTWLVGAMSRMVAEARDVAADVPPAIFRTFGQRLFGVQPIDATRASVLSTWTLNDNPSGRTIDAGTLVGIEDRDHTLHPFEVRFSVPLAGGVLTTPAGSVELVSVETGSQMSNIGGSGRFAPLIDSIVWINGVTLNGKTSGGSDGETDDEYLDRLADELTTLTPRPVVTGDYEVLARGLARRLGYQVRAVAIDGYDADADTYDNARTVTIYLIDLITGEDIPSSARLTVESQLRALREVNFLVYTRNATRTPINVSYTGKAHSDYDPESVQTIVNAAIADFLNPLTWGSITESGEWVNKTVIRQQDLTRVMKNIVGFDYWDTLVFGTGSDMSSEDINLPGAVALPSAGIITGSVT